MIQIVKMKALLLPISSPSRAEKFTPPQPLMRFLSGYEVSRSRTRMRAITIFGRRNAAGLIDETIDQEPSSPKVTCIGQVRARRATAESALSHGHTIPNRRRWWWLKKPLVGFKFTRRFRRYRAFRGIFFRWDLCSGRSGYGKKVAVREDSFVVESNPDSDKNRNCEAKVDQEIVPRNALSLTRCRSVPRRASSLGGRIWESTSVSCARGVFETENEPKPEQNFQEFRNPRPIISPESSKEPANTKNVVIEAHPLLLTRRKSGTVRTV